MRQYLIFMLILLLIGCAPTAEPISEVITEELLPPTNTPESTRLSATPTQAPTIAPPIASWCPLSDAPLVASSERLRIAYIHDGMIWVWDHDEGAPMQVTSNGDAHTLFLSDDGQVIAFLRGESRLASELWAVNTDGSALRQLVRPDEFKRIRYGLAEAPGYHVRVEWVPGTHLIAYNAWSYFGMRSGIYNVDPDDLHVVDADTGARQQILADGEGGHFLISPDGQIIAAMGYDYLTLVKPDGTGKRLDALDAYNTQGVGEAQSFPGSAWTPDSERLLLSITTQRGQVFQNTDGETVLDQDTNEVWSIPIDQSAPELIDTFIGNMFAFRFSADAAWLTYQDMEPDSLVGNDIGRLHIVNLESGEDVVTVSMPYPEFVGWSPDSQHYIYRKGNIGIPMLGDICGGTQRLKRSPLQISIDQYAYYYWIDPLRYVISVNNYVGEDDFGMIVKVDYHLAEVGGGYVSMLVEAADSFDFVLLPR